MEVHTELRTLTPGLRAAQRSGLRIGFVPTMGALHEGHLSLIRSARSRAEIVVASVFVNPTQFAPDEDLDRYPRDPEGDAEKLEQAGCHALFMPSADFMYPPGFQTRVSVTKVREGLCGARRPGHFDGVATVVLKLLLGVLPDVAVFGEKDFQQLTLIRRMVQDLNLGVEIAGGPIVRDADGLALSSRNRYLSADERQRALALSGALEAAKAAYAAGERSGPALIRAAAEVLRKADLKPEYLELRSYADLAPLEDAQKPCVILVAATVGSTRLIDNLILRRP